MSCCQLMTSHALGRARQEQLTNVCVEKINKRQGWNSWGRKHNHESKWRHYQLQRTRKSWNWWKTQWALGVSSSWGCTEPWLPGSQVHKDTQLVGGLGGPHFTTEPCTAVFSCNEAQLLEDRPCFLSLCPTAHNYHFVTSNCVRTPGSSQNLVVVLFWWCPVNSLALQW